MHNPIIAATLARAMSAERIEAAERRRPSGRPVKAAPARGARRRFIAGLTRRVQGERA
jgi:hypothetical protein